MLSAACCVLRGSERSGRMLSRVGWVLVGALAALCRTNRKSKPARRRFRRAVWLFTPKDWMGRGLWGDGGGG